MNSSNRVLALACSAILFGALSTVAKAQTNSATYQLDIPSQSLDSALQTLALVSHHRLLYISSLVEGKRSQALRGSYVAEDALAQLLRGTGLTFEFGPDSIVLIREMKSPATGATPTPTLKPTSFNDSEAQSDKPIRLAQADIEAPRAPERQREEQKPEEVIVTGTFIRRPEGAAIGAPVDTYGREYLDSKGVTGNLAQALADIPQAITVFSGAAGNGGGGGGTQVALEGQYGGGSMSLRGLGASGTLVLLNGSRQTVFPLNNDSRVDVNSLLPTIMVERIDILKDGASALYGSDAVGGVVNFLTRKNFTGFEIKASGQAATDTRDPFEDYNNYTLGMIAGSGNESTHAVAAFEYFQQSQFFRPDIKGNDWYTAAPAVPASFPGSFLVPQPDGSTRQVADPLCGQVAADNISAFPDYGTRTKLVSASLCGAADLYSLIAEGNRYIGRAEVSHELVDWMTLQAGFGYSETRTKLFDVPSIGPGTGRQWIVPASNPGNTFGVPVAFIGVPYSLTNYGLGEKEMRSNMQRLELGATGALRAAFPSSRAMDSWTYRVNYARSTQSLVSPDFDTNYANMQAALEGRGGPGGDQFFNPFASSLYAAPGSALWNDPALADQIRMFSTNFFDTSLSTIDALITGDLFSLPAGAVGMAIGLQHRSADLDVRWDAARTFRIGGRGGGDRDFGVSQATRSAFLEVKVPIVDGDFGRIDLDAAGRYEKQEGRDASFNPKVSLLYDASWLSLSGSWGTSTQAPSLFQVGGISYSPAVAIDPLRPELGSQVFSARIGGNPDLDDQESEAVNIDLQIRPIEGLSLDANYWRFDFQELIAAPSALGILTADPNSPLVTRNANGTLSQIDVLYFNAGRLKTDGIDFEVAYKIPERLFPGRFGALQVSAMATRVNSYDIQQVPNGRIIDGVGSANENNIGQAIARWKGGARISWSGEVASGYIGYRNYSEIDSLFGGTYRSQPIIDLQYSTPIGSLLTVSATLLNVFDERARVSSPASFIPFLYAYQDVRGRTLDLAFHFKF